METPATLKHEKRVMRPKVYILVLPVSSIFEALQVPKCVDVAINIKYHSYLSEVRALARLI